MLLLSVFRVGADVGSCCLVRDSGGGYCCCQFWLAFLLCLSLLILVSGAAAGVGSAVVGVGIDPLLVQESGEVYCC